MSNSSTGANPAPSAAATRGVPATDVPVELAPVGAGAVDGFARRFGANLVDDLSKRGHESQRRDVERLQSGVLMRPAVDIVTPLDCVR